MYYAHFILNKKGPLSKIWLAAHWDKKLTKAQIYETNIESTIETILEPQMKLALRTSGHLLLGVCRIYSRKVKYLLADCNEAFVKIKLAFRPGLIDLPKEKQQANADAITLPEKFPDLTVNLMADFSMMDKMTDLSSFGGKGISQQARLEDITLKEDFGLMGAAAGSSALIAMQDDDFGDMGAFDMDSFMFGGMEKGRRAIDEIANGHDDMTMEFMEDNLGTSGILEKDKTKRSEMSTDLDQMELDPKELTVGNLDNAPLIDDTMINDHDDNDQITHLAGQTGVVPTLFDDQPTVNNTNAEEPVNKKAKAGEIDMILEEGEGASVINDENKAPQAEKRIRNRKQRKLIIDDIKEIESHIMKQQLSDTRAILGTLELAPPTRRLMLLKESGSVDKLFSGTAKPVKSKLLQRMFVRTTANRLNESGIRGARDASRFGHDGEIEAQMQNEQSHLPLAELGSFVEVGQKTLDGSRPLDLTNRFDENDEFVGGDPGMTFRSIDDMVEPQVNLERTPGKDDHKKKQADDSDDEEVDGDKTKKSPKTKSPKRKSITKRSFRESQIEDLDDTVVDEAAAANDPNKLLTKRARTMVSLLNKSLTKYDNVSFFDMSRQNARKTVVQKFYSLLVLTKLEIIEVSQDEMYGDIIISKGDKFDTFNQSQLSQQQ